MAPQTLTHLLVGLMIATSSQVNANWSITFYESFDKCTGKDPNRNHYYTFSGDPNQSSATLRSECFIPGGDRVQQGIDTNMICAETVDGGATMQQCTPWSMPLKLKSWSWSLTAGSTCSWGAVRPYVDQQGICLGFTSAPTGDSVCYSSEHEVHVHGQDAPTMSFTCRCSDACKPKYLVGRVEEVANDTAMGEEEEDAAAVKDKQDILTGCKMM